MTFKKTMNISRLMVAAAAVASLSLTGCEKLDPTVAAPLNKPVTPDTPDVPDTPTVSDIPEGAEERKVTLDLSKTYQTIAGFAASDCWNVAWVGKYWTGKREELARYLFSQDMVGGHPQGIGLSMWRVNLGGGSYEQGNNSGITTVTRRAESYRRNGTTDGYDWTKCEGQRYFMEQAKTAGVESFVLFSNSPLVQYTYNGQARSDRGSVSNLKPEHYADFAGYLADVASHFRGEGYNITHISPINEPQFKWDGTDQEGSGYSTAEQVKLIRALDAALTEKNVATDILPGEATAWDVLYQNQRIANNFYEPSNANYIGNLDHVKNNLVGAHSYWSDASWAGMRQVRSRVAQVAQNLGMEVWQTEWSMLDSGYSSDEYSGFDNASEMENALYMSRVIHNDLTVANVSSWSYWTSMDVPHYGHKNRFVLIKLTPAGGEWGDITAGDGSYTVTPNLWVLGNYSRFVRPGYRRVDTAHDENLDFFGSSYVSADGKTLVSVYTNKTDKTLYLTDEFEGRDAVKAMRTYTTTATKHLTPTNIATNGGHAILEPQSVTTVIYEL